MPLRSAIRRTNIIVGATVAVVVFALSVTGVVLAYELRSIAGAQGPSHAGWDAKRLATFAGHGASREAVSTLVLHCGQVPCPSRDQMLVMAAAHLEVPYWTLATAVDSLGADPARAAPQ